MNDLAQLALLAVVVLFGLAVVARGSPLPLVGWLLWTLPWRILVPRLARLGPVAAAVRAAAFVLALSLGVALWAEDPVGMAALALSPGGLAAMVAVALLLRTRRRGRGRTRAPGGGAAAGRPAPFSVGALGGRTVRAGRNLAHNARVVRGYGAEVAEGVRERLPRRRRAAWVYLTAGTWVESNRPFWRTARTVEGLREDLDRPAGWRRPAVPRAVGRPTAVGGRLGGHRGGEGAVPPADRGMPPVPVCPVRRDCGGCSACWASRSPVVLGGRVRLPEDLRAREPDPPGRPVRAGRGWRGWGGS